MPIVTGEGRFTADFRVLPAGAFPGQSPVRIPLGMQFLARTSGTGPDQLDAEHHLRYTFAAGVPQDIDLLALVGLWIRLMFGKFAPVDPADRGAALVLGQPPLEPRIADAWAEIGHLTVRPGTPRNPGGFVLPASDLGYPVTATSRVLRMTATHPSTLDLLILGASS